MAATKATAAILSIGDMGLGIGKLLIGHNHKVITNVSGRSDWTVRRAQDASIALVDSDVELVQQADYILSIVPPRDAVSIATRVHDALASLAAPRAHPLFFLDLNAVSPATSQQCAFVLSSQSSVKFVDGGIIGGPAKLKDDGSWYRPSIPVAGPHKLPEDLAMVLNSRHISEDVGKASGVKMCFASLTKGFTALAVQSFTSAEVMGVLPELKRELQETAPALGQRAESGVLSCPPKAYRWVREMEEIGRTFSSAGFGGGDEVRGGGLFNAISEIYRFMAEESNCGKERTEDRKTTTADEVVADLAKSLKK